MQEVRESLRIIEQCYGQIEPGPVRATAAMLFRPASGRGLRADRGPQGRARLLPRQRRIDRAVPACHIRSPSFISLTLFREMLVGWKLADAIVTLGSLDFNMGEVDR